MSAIWKKSLEWFDFCGELGVFSPELGIDGITVHRNQEKKKLRPLTIPSLWISMASTSTSFFSLTCIFLGALHDT